MSALVPTDPFVPPDPERPAAPAAEPAARASRCRRRTTGAPTGPATSGPSQPEGALLGRPGPNVGYAYTLARAGARTGSGSARSSTPTTRSRSIAEIAGKRAAQFGRAPVIGDIELAIALLGYDGSASDDFVKARSALVHEAGHDYRRRRALVDAVPDALLRMRVGQASAEIESWRASMPSSLAASG